MSLATYNVSSTLDLFQGFSKVKRVKLTHTHAHKICHHIEFKLCMIIHLQRWMG